MFAAGIGPSSTSVAEMPVYVTRAPRLSCGSTSRSAGTASFGAFRSLTVTVNDFVAEFPALSAALHTTFVVPIAKTDPAAGLHGVATQTLGPSSTRSFFVAVKGTTAPHDAVAETTGAGEGVGVSAAPVDVAALTDGKVDVQVVRVVASIVVGPGTVSVGAAIVVL